MLVTKAECQVCPYGIRRENFVVICFPCMREVVDEMEKREIERKQAARGGCFCMRGGSNG